LNLSEKIRVIISGGGTGGHIFPAVSIANELKRRNSASEILFVGALGRMEMEKVPAEGYKIIGLPVKGFQRKLSIQNLLVIFNAFRSLRIAGKLIRDFKPDIVIGVGGYASGPTLREAARLGVPTLLQEQNSYAGITNRLLARKAKKICVAYSGMERYFPAEKIVVTGNPVRKITLSDELRNEGFRFFDLVSDLPVLLVLGGSLGARTINQSVLHGINRLISSNIQVIWQTGKYYFDALRRQILKFNLKHLRITDFISRMDLAYNVADLLISRAGAISISEICLVGKPAILIPSPNVAEDHQTKNAMALVNKNAALMVKDSEAERILIDEVFRVLNDESLKKSLQNNSAKLGKSDSASQIVDEIYKILEG
jgi:UDP-N-acetylglucosamine--N-acetylmuramyl-(pentapeptide) pyrophosphoryl-undecaprenol N-acetylglucosamine transferase